MKNVTTLMFLALLGLLFTACESEQLIEQTVPDNQLEEIQHLPPDVTPEYYTPKLEDLTVVLPRNNNFITIPAGSVDALEGAIEEANVGGIIYLRAGTHTLTKRLTISKTVKIIGEEGATLKVPTVVEGNELDPAIHILDAPSTLIQNLDISPEEGTSGTGILVENSPFCGIISNEIAGFNQGIVVELSDLLAVVGNTISNINFFGILLNAGKSVYIGSNTFTDVRDIGLWICDKWGTVENNIITNNQNGLLLCKYNEVFGVTTPGGNPLGAESTAVGCKLRGNEFSNNVGVGLSIRDSANLNLVESSNTYSNNGGNDIDIPADEDIPGFLFIPAAFKNTVFATDNVEVRDCGINNTIIGGTPVGSCD